MYNSGNVAVRTKVQIIGDVELHPDHGPVNVFPIDTQYYWDVGANWFINERFEVFAGINNLLDEKAPLMGFETGGDANTQVGLYDTVGIRYFLGTTVRFGQQ